MSRSVLMACAFVCIAGRARAAPLNCPSGSTEWVNALGARVCQDVDTRRDVFTEPRSDPARPRSSVPRDPGSSEGSTYYRALRRDPFRQ